MSDKLEAFLAACDPALVLRPDAARKCYAERNDDFRLELSVLLRAPNARVRVLGQTGTGKSTELAMLAHEMDKDFAVIVPPIDRFFDMALVTWPELMVTSLFYVKETNCIPDTPMLTNLSELLFKTRLDQAEWVRNLGRITRQLSGAGERVLPEPTTVQYLRDHAPAVREKLTGAPAQFADISRQASAEIEENLGKPVVVLLDGLEKLPVTAARRLFHDEGRFALDLPFRFAVVAPHWLLFEDYAAEAEQYYPSGTVILRAISCLHTLKVRSGRKFFREMVERRGGGELFCSDALEHVIDQCAGIPRQLLKMCSSAASLAIVEGCNSIDKTHVTRARERAMETLYYQLKEEDYKTLGLFKKARESGPHLARLLRLGAVVEYGKQGSLPNLGINPLAVPLLRRYQSFVETRKKE